MIYGESDGDFLLCSRKGRYRLASVLSYRQALRFSDLFAAAYSNEFKGEAGEMQSTILR